MLSMFYKLAYIFVQLPLGYIRICMYTAMKHDSIACYRLFIVAIHIIIRLHEGCCSYAMKSFRKA